MNLTLPFPNVSFLRNRQPTLSEIENLLDLFHLPTLLLDLDRSQIILANAKATELTAFTRLELTSFVLNELLPTVSKGIEENSDSGNFRTYHDSLTIRKGTDIKVRVELTLLNPQWTWALVTIEPVEQHERKAAEIQRQSQRLTDLYALACAGQESDTEQALQQILDTGQRLTGADTLVLYLVDVSEPGLQRSLSLSSMDDYPDKLPPDEINAFLEPTIWVPGKRASNALFRAARMAKQTYLTSYPLGEQDAFIGLLVIAGNEGVIPEDNQSISQILVATITSIIQQSSLHKHFLANEKIMRHNLTIGESIKENSQDGIIILSPDLMIEDLNPAAETILGYATREIYDQPVNNILIGPSNLIPALQAAQQGISTPNLGEVHLHRRDGVAVLSHISIIPLIVNENIDGVIILVSDLSAHEEFKIRNQQLEQRAVLGEVTAIFAHEVRNPMNNISTGLQLLNMNLPQDDPNQEIIGRLSDDCNRLTHLMQSVLTFSRPPENKYQIVNLSELLPNLIERWRPRLARLNVSHEFNASVDNAKVNGDARALEQVFNNLIGNASEAMKETGGTITINIRYSQDTTTRKFIEVNVIDNGPGIPKELLERIFEPFVTTNRNGTGLGLSIAKRIVTSHQGTINVASIPGGTVFQVRFPLAVDNEA
jgi:two-component system sensor histidine kinase AtoS